MPYIRNETRPTIDVHILPLVERLAAAGHIDGELNYAISKLLHEWVLSRPAGLRYEAVKEVEAALGCVGKEFYRVVSGPYEDLKSQENGPVSVLDAPVNLGV